MVPFITYYGDGGIVNTKDEVASELYVILNPFDRQPDDLLF